MKYVIFRHFNPIFQRLAVSWAYLQSLTAKHSTSYYIVYSIKVKTVRVCAHVFCCFFFAIFRRGLSFLISWTTSSKDGTTHKGKNLFISERSQTYLQKLISIIKIGSKTEMRELLKLHYLLLLLYVSQVHKLRLYRLFLFHQIFGCDEQLKDLNVN